MKLLSLLLEGPAKLCLWGAEIAAAGKGQYLGEERKKRQEAWAFSVDMRLYSSLSLEKTSGKLQGFASHDQLHLLHLGAQLSWSSQQSSDSHPKHANCFF